MYGLVAPGYADGRGRRRPRCSAATGAFTGADMSTKLKLLGVDVASFGDAFATTEGALRRRLRRPGRRGLQEAGASPTTARRLLGGILVGDASAYGMLRPLVASGMALPANPEELILPGRRRRRRPGRACPTTAQVCSCNNVTKGAICAAIDEQGCADRRRGQGVHQGRHRPAAPASRWSRTCSTSELEAAGRTVATGLCEHFALSRQELFDLVAVHGYRRFDDIVEAHGRGRGCEVCKPAVASILASLFNGHVLDGEQAALQDTNDHFLANIQRDGTYSVVPRIPGGEITPEKLIVIGEVARDFGLYTKITGGQRIDLFGARVEQLPAIWRRLVDAGFESGHAYGKSLRTVKSCVGSTWCRYGVQDSVGLAIDARDCATGGCASPHKLKSAVSGCARECAEARSKDFGVIATEKGWNLYVGGNGGADPAHAELLAADLDDETLVRYLDRFLMFYIRTADRLQRTATWLDAHRGRPRPRPRGRRRRLARPRRRARGGDGPPRRHVRRRVARHPRRPGEAGPVRLVRQRARHPGPEHQLHHRPRADPARGVRPSPSSWAAPIPVGAP